MSEYLSVFERVEKKYLLSHVQYLQLQKRLTGRVRADQYAQSTICNIYFDTPTFQLVRASLEKPVYKEKLRLRSYGVPTADSGVFVEIKKKYEGVVYKRRVGMPYRQALDYLYQGVPVQAPSQVTREIDWLLQFYPGIAPAMFLSYRRLAFTGVQQAGLRITFDDNLLWRRDALLLDRGAWGDPLLQSGQVLMELKTPGALPVWLARELDALAVYPTAYSKYGSAYRQLQRLDQTQKGVTLSA